VAEVTATDVQDLTDLQSEMSECIPCERPHARCSHPAEWIAWRACCGHEIPYMFYCTPHKDYILMTDEALQCVVCGEITHPGRLLFRLIEPLNAGGGR
jgi:hypothetical protein